MHRAGRTGRMNKSGTVVTLGDDHDFRNMRKLVADQYLIERVYFKGYQLTTQKPEEKQVENSKQDNKKTTQVSKKQTKHKKKRWRNKKNKGYHPKNKEGVR